MPMYNAQEFLEEAINSILNQSFTDFEFLIGDDCSTDTSLQLAENISRRDSRVKVIKNDRNSGVSFTRNQLYDISNGEYIAVMDADDVALPERLEQQVKFLNDNKDYVCVGSNHGLIDKHGYFLTVLKLPETDNEIQSLALKGHGSICHPCAMIRSEALSKVNGYNENLSSALDLDIWLKLGEVGKLYNLQSQLLNYRLHENSISGSKGIKQRQNAKIACESAWKRRGIDGRFEAAEPWRPQNNRKSKLYFSLKYGWWAYKSKSKAAAVHYAKSALKAWPLSKEAWSLLIRSFSLNTDG